MARVMLILVAIFILACVSLYIFDIQLGDRRIGHQSDEIQTIQPAAEATVEKASPAVPTKVPTPKPSPVKNSKETAPQPSILNQPTPQITGSNGWTMIWSDDFNTPQLNVNYWTAIDRKDNYNKELQYYTPLNACLENGCLVLTAKHEEKDGKEYTSAMIDSNGKLFISGGRIEACISMPVGKGVFPAFWMINDSGKYELDIVELIGSEPDRIYGVTHYVLNGGKNKTYGQTAISDPRAFHIYAVEWDANEIRWYLDGAEFYSSSKGVPDEALYIAFSLAVGGDWPGDPDSSTVFPCSMKVDYIRLYQPASTN